MGVPLLVIIPKGGQAVEQPGTVPSGMSFHGLHERFVTAASHDTFTPVSLSVPAPEQSSGARPQEHVPGVSGSFVSPALGCWSGSGVQAAQRRDHQPVRARKVSAALGPTPRPPSPRPEFSPPPGAPPPRCSTAALPASPPPSPAPAANTSPRPVSGVERERKVSMRLHRGAPVNISSSDLTGRQDTSRMSTSQVRTSRRRPAPCAPLTEGGTQLRPFSLRPGWSDGAKQSGPRVLKSFFPHSLSFSPPFSRV